MNRREFLASHALAAPALALQNRKRPNFLFLIADQLSIDAVGAHGNRFVRTPNLDRIANSGVSFLESYCTNPVCGPSRSSMFTGRMPSETGVFENGGGIRQGIPNLGEWMSARGYDTVYSGKWHVPQPQPARISGFTVLPGGIGGQGHLGDAAVSRACQAWLHNRTGNSTPFLLVGSLLQPHDICSWIDAHRRPDWEKPARFAEPLPPLPANFEGDRKEPAFLRKQARPQWTHDQWRYYLWSYYRHVEMVDAEIGRILDALEDSGHARNTVVMFVSDHGEGGAHQQMVLKNFLYDSAARVPFFVSWPGETPARRQNQTHLVSGVDIVPTVCDYAGIPAPRVVGRSLRPLIEGKNVEWREMLVSEAAGGGRMVRTREAKYVCYPNDPVEQLFDWRKDSGETRNVAAESRYASTLADHQRLLKSLGSTA